MSHFDISRLYFYHSLVSAGVCASVAGYLFVHRQVPGARYLMALMIAVGEWALTYALEFRATTLQAKLFWVRLEYFGGAWTGFFVLVFVLFITGRSAWMTRVRLAGLAIVPVVTPILALTNDWHHLMWQKAWIETSAGVEVMAYHRGPGFWTFAGASYLMLLAASVILVRAYLHSHRLQRKQLHVILMGIAAPWLSNALYLSGTSPVSRLDLTPVAFTFSGLAFAWGLFRYRLLDIVPVAREMVMDAMADAVLVLDPGDRVIDLNPPALALAGKSGKNPLNRPMAEVLPAFFPAVVRHRGMTMTRTQIEAETDQGPGLFHLMVSPLRDRRGNPGGWLVMLQDITEQRRIENALRESEEKFRSISANALDALFMIGPDNGIAFWNKAAEEIFEYRAPDVMGKDLFDILPPPTHRQAYRKAFDRFLAPGHPPLPGRTVELPAVDRSGRRLTVELSVSAISLNGQRHAVGILRDVSERLRTEREREQLRVQLQHAQKMEAIGTLAGGVAHDLNNILMGIVSYPDLILSQLPADSALRKPVQTMQTSGQKAAAMVQDLLALARRGVSVREAVDINEVVSGYMESPEHQSLMANHPLARISLRLAPELGQIMGSPVHLSKVVMNLVANAVEAVETEGTVEILTENRQVTQTRAGVEKIPRGEYTVLTISDSGCGIRPEDRERIFEPFYTRKAMGRSGTGLGMSVVWGTVKDHGGHIDLDTRLGVGTRFSLYFPITQTALPRRDTPCPRADMKGRGETVLLVDDEPQQREIAAQMLTALNYAVKDVPSGEAAAAWLQSHQADLVVLDMIMAPGMDGLDTCRAILKSNPGQPVIIASGYSETGRVREAQRLGAGGYLQKPYTLEALGKAVQDALNGRKASC